MKNRTRSTPYFQHRRESVGYDLDMEAAAELTGETQKKLKLQKCKKNGTKKNEIESSNVFVYIS